MKRMGLFLLLLGWVAYLVSWFVPVEKHLGTLPDGKLPGWEAFTVALGPIFPPYGDDASLYAQAIFWVLSALTNLSVLLSPFVVFRTSLRRRSSLAGWVLILCAGINSYWFFVSDRADLRIGYYLWWLSFALLAVRFFLAGRAQQDVLASCSKPAAL